jgi:hypothetical protein
MQLATDLLTGFGAAYLLWQQSLILGVCIAFIPSTLISLYIIAKVDLEKYKASNFGFYVRKHMASKAADWVRFGGFAVMLLGGWLRFIWLAGFGFLIILLVWTNGLFAKSLQSKKPSN